LKTFKQFPFLASHNLTVLSIEHDIKIGSFSEKKILITES